jgi:hypothetical protein
LEFREKGLYHQIHPLKLAVDVAGGCVSTLLVWEHRLAWAALTGFVPSIVVSALMLRFLDFDRQRDSAFGRYLRVHMTPWAQAVRLGGQLVMWIAAWYRAPAGIGAGFAVIVFGWIHGKLPPWSRSAQPRGAG